MMRPPPTSSCLVGKVDDRRSAKADASLPVVGPRSISGRIEATEVGLLAVDVPSRDPRAGIRRIVKDPSKARLVGHQSVVAIQPVNGQSKVLSTVVEAISVDVINLHPIGRRKDSAMHEHMALIEPTLGSPANARGIAPPRQVSVGHPLPLAKPIEVGIINDGYEATCKRYLAGHGLALPSLEEGADEPEQAAVGRRRGQGDGRAEAQ